MKTKKSKNIRSGAALLVVLFVVMAITVLALGFLSKTSVESACGDNMSLRIQTDYLAESGLEQAKGLILNPQDVTGEYWQGAESQQLVAGSSDFYEVEVEKVGQCDYQISSSAYRLTGNEQTGRSRLQAELRLDPCIAFWTGSKITVQSNTTVNGDVYCGDDLVNYGTINGDVFAAGALANYGTITGRAMSAVTTPPVNPPAITTSDFSSQYYYNGSGPYSVGVIAVSDLSNVTLGPTAGNPAGIYYCNSTLKLSENIVINGALVVKDYLEIRANANVIITGVKNFPALIVGYDLSFEESNTKLKVTGLARVNGFIDMKNQMGSSINIFGALFISEDIRNTINCGVNITASPDNAALEIWNAGGGATRWSPAADAFFKSIERF